MKRFAPSLSLLLFLACAESPTQLEHPGPMFDISDAVHDNGNEHFFWLPPLVPNPSPGGTFDGSLSPVVEICDLGAIDPAQVGPATPCLAPAGSFPITYTMATGPGSETVRLEAADEHYIVNWHTDELNLSASNTYRLRVFVEDVALGHADVDVVNSGKEVKNVQTGEFIALKDGRTLPIKFRVEEGADVVNACETVTLADPAIEAEVRNVLGIPTGPITEADALTLTQLTVRNAGVTDLSGLECFTNLVWLKMAGNAIADLTPLAPLTSLTLLELGSQSNTFSDLAPLSGMTDMQHLNVAWAPVTSIVPLAGMTDMRSLGLIDAPLGGDLSALAGMNQLVSLRAENVGLTDLSAVAGKTSLASLRINNNSVSDLSPVASLTGLTEFRAHANTFSNLTPLAGLTGLTILQAGGSLVSDLTPLSGLTNLVELNLVDLGSLSSISGLSALVNLKHLSLRNSPSIGGDVSALAGMGQLEQLHVQNIGLNSVAFVSNHLLLTRLRAAHNSITNVSPLLGLTALTNLEIQGNPVGCTDPDIVTLIGSGVTVICT